jgi:large subunit ribosomal protein L15
MQLNSLSPAPGSTKARKRVGRGIGSGWGKTCGTGHKGQKSRSGGSVRPGFEGGQMPLQMRLPKFGFSSRVGRFTAEVRTSELNGLDADVIDIEVLRKANLITATIKRVKVMFSGDVTKALTLKGVRVTKGAQAAIEAAGGKIIDGELPPKIRGKLAKKPAKAPAKTDSKS